MAGEKIDGDVGGRGDPTIPRTGEYGVRRTTVIDTPEGIELFRLCSMRGRLKLEINSGLKFRVSTLKVVNRHLGSKCRTKKQALEVVEEHIKALTLPLTEDPL